MTIGVDDMTRQGTQGSPLPDPVAEGARIAAAARPLGLSLRLMGGVGIAHRCPSASAPPLSRTYADIDLAGRRRELKRLVELLAGLGYEPDRQFNAMHGARRLFFWDGINGRQVDVFLDTFEMCHRLDLSERVRLPGDTLPLADLLLTKLQVVETNEKDLKDVLAVLVDHPFTEDDGGINLAYLAALTAHDWGLWKTVTLVAERADHYARAEGTIEQRTRVHEQIRDLLGRLDQEPKSRGWRLRAKVGERVRWYELPEEGH